jgi:hypothetical protein
MGAAIGLAPAHTEASGIPYTDRMARPERFELPTSWFVAMRSIQLSYGRVIHHRRAMGLDFKFPM